LPAALAVSPNTGPQPPEVRKALVGTTTPGIPDPPLPFTGGRIPASEAERAGVERRVMAQFFVAPALSFAALGGGFNLGWPRLAAAGVIGLGLTALVIGYLAVSERRLMFIRGNLRTLRQYRYFIYEGVAAVPYGLAFAVAGAVLVVPAVLFLSGTGLEFMRDAALARPHLALIPGGAGLLCNGLGFVIGFRRAAVSIGERIEIALLHLPAQLGGLILVALGAAALALGFVEWLRPEVFQQGFRVIFGNPWPFGAASA
jgi:hypothetical protein